MLRILLSSLVLYALIFPSCPQVYVNVRRVLACVHLEFYVRFMESTMILMHHDTSLSVIVPRSTGTASTWSAFHVGTAAYVFIVFCFVF